MSDLLLAPPGGVAMFHTRRYRLRIFDGTYEVLHQRAYYVTVDLSSAMADHILNRQLVALVQEARAANEPMDAPRLEVWDDNVKVMDWTGS
jgi:hypothetical protein